jgi:hypothetical protein
MALPFVRIYNPGLSYVGICNPLMRQISPMYSTSYVYSSSGLQIRAHFKSGIANPD